MMEAEYQERVNALMHELGIPRQIVTDRGLSLCLETEVLVEAVCKGKEGRLFLLEPEAASAWNMLQRSAKVDGIDLVLVSAFRSVDYQADIIRRKLQQGISLEVILSVSAIPGYSEHHTGRAVDIGTPESLSLDACFEQTSAFEWLSGHASNCGFVMSYPRNNRYGYIYEPWHWCFQGKHSI
ncbi:D-alanyl-D-alanine carboxypeptidase family protein [Methylobacillus gramineus]|uniref:M15 family metallopeptidase n=1 Tax=Methylobacillus gramineus TaxID=755169 RepID=UPI001CFF6090|nr:M15 family metallopeptidase [Methylobacillus gramineus]MCB5185784.1 D-alanyl-D-alanine carboxypeptidase family protein [Methylobacillus gramineus]